MSSALSRLAVMCLALLLPLPAASGGMAFVSLGSGEFGAGYYQTAKALCERVNRIDRRTLRCSPEATSGSIYNIRGLRARDLDLAIVQSDWASHARAGTAVFRATGPWPDLVAVAALYVEAVTVLARPDAGIGSFADLRRKRVDHGLPASGRRATMAMLLDRFGMSEDEFAEAVELPAGAVVPALCDGRIDATVLVVGHPSAIVQRAISECGAVLVPVTGPAVEALVADSPAYSPYVVPGGLYGAGVQPVHSLGTTALLMTRRDVDAAVVEGVARTMVRDSRVLAQRVPLLRLVTPDSMAALPSAVPLHPAAQAALGR